MSVRSESVTRPGSKDTIKKVRLQDTPDYIPTITGSVVADTNAGAVAEDKSNKQWGRVKNIAQIRNEINLEIGSDGSAIRKPVGIDDFKNVAQVFMKSKKVLKRVRTKYSARALKMLQKRQTQSSLNGDVVGNYSLVDMHNKIKRQRHLKLALLQKRFIDELPELKEKSVKEHLERKIEILQKLKNSAMVKDALHVDYDHVRPVSDQPTRRQSRLRQSLDLTNCPKHSIDKSANLMNVALTVTDVEREIAVTKSREKIEADLKLPLDRSARLTTLKANVDKINTKYNVFVHGKKGDTGKSDTEKDEKKPYYAPSRFHQHGMAKRFFRKHARIVVIVTQWINMIMDKQLDFEKELKSFVDIANEIEDQTVSSTMLEFGLQFDKKYYKANREISLSSEARKILTTAWQSRTPEMIKQVMNGLQSLRSLSEYPVQTQEKLCKVAWYQTIGPKKPIVRQGHHAESFYFILSGTAFVKKMVQDPVTGETKGQVAARLTKGHSFGEIGLLFDTLRTATVESATPMELLVIGKEDFVRIFMKAEDPDDEADHIKFLRNMSFMSYWPIDVLNAEPGACLTHYFKRGSLITDNDRHSEWIYFVMSGSCEVLKKLKAVTARDHRELRPKSDPLSDIILPELGMPNNHARIDTRKCRAKKATIDPEVFQDMTNFYDSLRRKYEHPEPQTPQTPAEQPTFMEMPQQADTQLPKLFMRSASARKRPDTEKSPKVRFLETKQKTDGDFLKGEPKLVPIPTDSKRRPVSRSRFDENTPKMQIDHFIVPSPKKLNASYRPLSRNTECDTMQKEGCSDDVFVKVERLNPKECFGLNTLKFVMDTDDDVFDVGDEDAPILSLVSRGAEVIMLSKKVFLKYADQRCRMRVRNQIKVYPSEEVMQGNMQKEADWRLYKENTLSHYIKIKQHNQVKPRSKSTNY